MFQLRLGLGAKFNVWATQLRVNACLSSPTAPTSPQANLASGELSQHSPDHDDLGSKIEPGQVGMSLDLCSLFAAYTTCSRKLDFL